MKRIVMCLILGSWAVAVAQAPPGEEPADEADVVEQALPCVPASETSALESEQEDAGPSPVPCEELNPEVAMDEELDSEVAMDEELDSEIASGLELDPELALGEELSSAEASGETVADPETIAEEDSVTEATADEEFKPGDEISEDYPVPLPSDI